MLNDELTKAIYYEHSDRDKAEIVIMTKELSGT